MITFHEIRRIIQKMAVLSSHIVQMNQLLPQVIQLSEKIDSLNDDLTLDRDRMTAKIRSVEVLGEILKTHVYCNTTELDLNELSIKSHAGEGPTVEEKPLAPREDSRSDQVNQNADEGNEGFIHPKPGGRALML